jgi:D-amino-acid oxidase
VVGAGVVGLTSAVRLAEAGHPVDVLARELPLETTSAAGGGLWLPPRGDPSSVVHGWARRTLAVLLGLAGAADAPTGGATRSATGIGAASGVEVREGYLLRAGYSRPAWAEELTEVPLAAVLNPAPGHDHGWQLRVPLVDPSVYLPYLVRRLEAADGTLTRLPLTALPTRGIVVNCTGLASRALAADPSVGAVRGQLLRLTNPGLTRWWWDDSARPTYVLPHAGHVVVGGTADPDDWSTTADPQTADDILQRACTLVPALGSASVLSHRVGLLPARPTVRLETTHTGTGTVIHCYGHAGSGLTLSWGCADDVLLAVDQLARARSQA